MYQWGQEEVRAAVEVLESGNLFRYTADSRTAAFEREFADRLTARHALAVHSGTSALVVALAACGIGPGDEVIVPAYTFVASAAAVVWVGAVPILCEVDNSLTLDPNDVAAHVSGRTKAILAVHMLGAPANLDALRAIAHAHDLILLEDCAQACGAEYKGRSVGTMGSVGCFSFNQSKILSCGEGGAVITDDERTFVRLRMAHDPGSLWRRHVSPFREDEFPGLGVRMDEVRAAVLRVQLQRLPDILSNLKRAKCALKRRIAGITGLECRTIHDADGDTSTTLAMFLPTADMARRFVATLAEDGIRAGTEFAAALGRSDQDAHTMYDAGRPDRHIYRFWTYIMNKGVPQQHGCSYECPRYSGGQVFTPDMCPTTLDLLGRGLLLGINPDWTTADVDRMANVIGAAASELVA